VSERGELDAREADERFRHAFESFQKLIAGVDDPAERARLEDVLWERALVDDLTGLHNRRSFMLLAEQALKEAARAKRPLITLFLDVDGLKAINDEHGHVAGDRALRWVAEVLRANRRTDRCARLGGDEFAALLPDTDPLAAAHVARRLCAALRAGAEYDFPITLSLGIATAPQDGATSVAVYEAADAALYAAKRRGGDQVVHTGALDEPCGSSASA